MEPIVLLAVAALPVLLGVGWVWASRRDRRRRLQAERLAAAASASGDAVAPASSGPRAAQARSRTASPALGRLSRYVERVVDFSYVAPLQLLIAAAVGAGLSFFLTAYLLQLSLSTTVWTSAVAAIAFAVALARQARSRYQARFLEVFPDAIDLLVRAIRAGLPVTEAIDAASNEVPEPVRSHLRQLIEELRIGTPFDTALAHAADRIKLPDFRFLAVTLILQRQTGGNMAEPLENLSQIIRRRKEVRMKANAATSEARLTIWVMAAFPFVMGAFLMAANPEQTRLLIDDPRGTYMSGIGICAVLAGLVTMHVMVKRTLRHA